MERFVIEGWRWDLTFWLGLFPLVCALLASGHAVLKKRESRSAAGWVGIIWLVPLLGSLLYLLFGINRITRTAKGRRRGAPLPAPHAEPLSVVATEQMVLDQIGDEYHLATLEQLGSSLTRLPLLLGNRLTPLVGGDEAYPQMLAAIDSAKESVSLSTYIFDFDRAGVKFAEALARAHARGVEVRVLIDDFGARYSHPSITKKLREQKVPNARFIPTMRPRAIPHLNLRKHRKTIVVDGKLAFTGGMNIREGHQLSLKCDHPVQDTHFRVEGPLVTQLQDVFADDWAFAAGEVLDGPRWFKEVPPVGTSLARAVSDGPDEDFGRLSMLLLGAIGAAQESIKLSTPYFLPDTSLANSLYVAAQRGVEVDIILPAQNNLKFVGWAMNPQLQYFLMNGCKVWLTPPPFDHSKLMVVDKTWTLLGSANWDPRSLRLNFELNVECYDPALAHQVDAILEGKKSLARPLTLAELQNRSLAAKLRDGAIRLFEPYL